MQIAVNASPFLRLKRLYTFLRNVKDVVFPCLLGIVHDNIDRATEEKAWSDGKVSAHFFEFYNHNPGWEEDLVI
jgi:hypothetical protein